MRSFSLAATALTRRDAGPFVRGFDALLMLPLGVSAVTVGFGFLIALDEPPLDLRASWILVPLARSILPLQQPGVFLNEIQDYIIEKGKRLDASQYNNCRSTKTKIHRTLTEMLREKEIEREVAKTANGRESHRYILPRRDEPTESRSTKYWTDENLINQGSGQNTEASTLRGNEVSNVQGRTKSPRGAVYIDVCTTHGIDSSPNVIVGETGQ